MQEKKVKNADVLRAIRGEQVESAFRSCQSGYNGEHSHTYEAAATRPRSTHSSGAACLWLSVTPGFGHQINATFPAADYYLDVGKLVASRFFFLRS